VSSSTKLEEWPPAPLLIGPRLVLEPLRVGHAEEMAGLLDDPLLHAFTGGRPSTEEELRRRYRSQAGERSHDGSQRWFNWIVRLGATGPPAGTVQATVTVEDGRCIAALAWVIATEYQRRGYAREAAIAMVAWLRAQGADRLVAHIHPAHRASMNVARALAMAPTDEVVGGEIRWRSED
jgi:RimJ/RimL family protein N-acetyltransferase